MAAKGNAVAGQGCPGSDDLGLDWLYRRYSAVVRRYIERNFGNGPPDPDDVVQAAFERYAQAGQHETVRHPGAFLKRTAANVVLDHRRAERVRSAYAAAERDSEAPMASVDGERLLETRERLAIIEQAIMAMDERRRTILILSRIHGQSAAEIARRIGCSPTLVKIRLAEAVALCQQAIDMRESAS